MPESLNYLLPSELLLLQLRLFIPLMAIFKVCRFFLLNFLHCDGCDTVTVVTDAAILSNIFRQMCEIGKIYIYIYIFLM